MPFITPEELKERKQSDKISVVFGRFQPPTLGHKALFDKAVKISEQFQTDVILVPTSTCEKKVKPVSSVGGPKEAKDICSKIKYPLTYDQKKELLVELYPENVFPKHRFLNIETNKNLNNLYGLLDYLAQSGYTELYFVSGDDRVEEFGKRIKEYNDTNKKNKAAHFNQIVIIDVGETDTGRLSRVPIEVLSESVEVSGTIVRISAILGLQHVFYKTIKTYDGFTMEQSNEWMRTLRKGMGYYKDIVGDMTEEAEKQLLNNLLEYLKPKPKTKDLGPETKKRRISQRGGFYIGYLLRLLR